MPEPTNKPDAIDPVWVVVNRDTGIVVSRWTSETAAVRHKDRRDAKWRDIEPASKLEVRVAHE